MAENWYWPIIGGVLECARSVTLLVLSSMPTVRLVCENTVHKIKMPMSKGAFCVLVNNHSSQPLKQDQALYAYDKQ